MAGKLTAVVPKNHLLLPSVQESLQQLDTADEAKDAGLRRLAEVYAAAIDEALDVAIDARQLVADALDEDNPLEIAKRLLNALVKYSDSNAVLEQLGPKLQAVLESLGASPKARSQITGKGAGAPNVPPGGQSPFERRRAAAAAREQAARTHGSPAVDTTA